MSVPPRIAPQEARQKVKSGQSLLVCAYTDEGVCKSMHLEDAIFMKEFEKRLPTLPKEQEIIFYCA
jgi:hypothetical protein